MDWEISMLGSGVGSRYHHHIGPLDVLVMGPFMIPILYYHMFH